MTQPNLITDAAKAIRELLPHAEQFQLAGPHAELDAAIDHANATLTRLDDYLRNTAELLTWSDDDRNIPADEQAEEPVPLPEGFAKVTTGGGCVAYLRSLNGTEIVCTSQDGGGYPTASDYLICLYANDGFSNGADGYNAPTFRADDRWDTFDGALAAALDLVAGQ